MLGISLVFKPQWFLGAPQYLESSPVDKVPLYPIEFPATYPSYNNLKYLPIM